VACSKIFIDSRVHRHQSRIWSPVLALCPSAAVFSHLLPVCVYLRSHQCILHLALFSIISIAIHLGLVLCFDRCCNSRTRGRLLHTSKMMLTRCNQRGTCVPHEGSAAPAIDYCHALVTTFTVKRTQCGIASFLSQAQFFFCIYYETLLCPLSAR